MRQVPKWTEWVATATVALMAGCASAPRGDPEASDKRYLLAADYYAKGAHRPAIAESLKAVELDPQNAEAHSLLGILFLRQAADVEEMIERSSCTSDEEARLARQEIESKFKAAEEQFRLAVNCRPTFSEAWNSLAVVSLHFQRWDDAVAAATKALGNIVYAEPWAAQANLAWAYFHKKDLMRAMQELRAALHANSRFCVGRYRLAKVFFEQGNLNGAETELEQLAADRACPIQEAFLLLGQINLGKETPEGRKRASEVFRRCVELAPQSCLARQCRPVN